MGATDSAPSLKAAVLTGSVRTIDAKRWCFASSARTGRKKRAASIGARLARWQKNA